MLATLTSTRLDIIDDDALEQTIALKISKVVRSDIQHDYLEHLSPGLRMVYSTSRLELEVRRLGFERHFTDAGGYLAANAVQGYLLIGASCRSEIVADALRAFVSPARAPYVYAALEDAFKDLEPAGPLKVDYIRANPEQFAAAQ